MQSFCTNTISCGIAKILEAYPPPTRIHIQKVQTDRDAHMVRTRVTQILRSASSWIQMSQQKKILVG